MTIFRKITFGLCILSSTLSFADTIVLKDATTINAFNVEEAGRWVIYTLEDSENSPLQRISIDKVFAIKTNDGELKTVGNQTAEQANTEIVKPASSTDGPQYIAPTPSADNAAHIAAYNSPKLMLKKPKPEKDKEKYCSDFLTVWGITSNSIISDENVDVDLVMVPQAENGEKTPQYKTRITNKTGNTIYIDLANSFKVRGDGSVMPYFTNATYTEGTSGSKGGSLNLGAVAGAIGLGGFAGTLASGVNVGGGSTKSASVTTTQERILTVPAFTSVFLPPSKYAKDNAIREDYDVFYFATMKISPNNGGRGLAAAINSLNEAYLQAVEEGGLDDAHITKDVLRAPQGWLREFDESESPKTVRRIITYSTSPNFDTYTAINIGLYIRAVMGSSLRWNVPVNYDTKYLTTDDEKHLIIGIGKVNK